MFGSAVTGAGRAGIMTGFQADGFSARDRPRCGSKVGGNGAPTVGFGSEVTGDSASISDHVIHFRLPNIAILETLTKKTWPPPDALS